MSHTVAVAPPATFNSQDIHVSAFCGTEILQLARVVAVYEITDQSNASSYRVTIYAEYGVAGKSIWKVFHDQADGLQDESREKRKAESRMLEGWMRSIMLV